MGTQVERNPDLVLAQDAFGRMAFSEGGKTVIQGMSFVEVAHLGIAHSDVKDGLGLDFPQ